MRDFVLWIASPGVVGIWTALSMAVMILPMIWLALWYHGRIGGSAGGRALMEKQSRSHYRPDRAAEMARDIASGHYGDKAQRMQSTVYKVIAFWLLACVVMFGLLIWGMELREAA